MSIFFCNICIANTASKPTSKTQRTYDWNTATNTLNYIMSQSIQNPINLKNSMLASYSSFSSSSHCQLPPAIAGMKESVYEALTDRKTKEKFTKLMEYYEAQNAYYNSKEEPEEQPDIKVTITKVTSEVLKHDIKKAWGVEITIGESVIPIYIGSTAAAMIYISTLLKQKMGTCLYRDTFKHPLPNKSRHEDVIWLEQVYHKLFLGAEKNFDTWYKDMQKDSCRFINQGKSESKRRIKDSLTNYPSAIDYCQVQKIGGRNERPYYYINIPKENITVPKALECLISTAPDNE